MTSVILILAVALLITWVIKKSNLWRNGSPLLYACLAAVLAATGFLTGSTIGQNAFGIGWLQRWVFVEGAEGGVLGIGALKILILVALGLILGTSVLKGLRGFMGGKGWLAKPFLGNSFLGLSAVGVIFMFSIFGMAAKHRQIDLSDPAGVAGTNIFRSTVIEAILLGEDGLKQIKGALTSDELPLRNRMGQLQQSQADHQGGWYTGKQPPSGGSKKPETDFEALYNQSRQTRQSGSPTPSRANRSSQTKKPPKYHEGNEPPGSFWEEQTTLDNSTNPGPATSEPGKEPKKKKRLRFDRKGPKKGPNP